jgi:hypothetical protein
MTAPAMRWSPAVAGLSALVAALAAISAGAGLFWRDGGAPFTVTTTRGGSVTLFGDGVYRYDTLFGGAANRGTDAVTLGIGIPLLVLAIVLYWRGSLRGSLFLIGVLGYFLYISASVALGAAFNPLFLVSIALFSASLFAFVGAFASIDLAAFGRRFSATMPRRGPGWFMVASGLVTAIVWLLPLSGALLAGQPPRLLGHYTTSVTDVLDLGIITPAAFLAGALILRGRPLGYAIACSLLVLEAMLAPMIVAQTISQLSAGITFGPGEMIGPMGGFLTIAVAAIWALIAILRNVEAPPVVAAGNA